MLTTADGVHDNDIDHRVRPARKHQQMNQVPHDPGEPQNAPSHTASVPSQEVYQARRKQEITAHDQAGSQ